MDFMGMKRDIKGTSIRKEYFGQSIPKKSNLHINLF